MGCGMGWELGVGVGLGVKLIKSKFMFTMFAIYLKLVGKRCVVLVNYSALRRR